MKKTKNKNININDILSLIAGLLGPFYVEIIGQFYLSEILLIFIFPIILINKKNKLYNLKYYKQIILFGIIWLFGQILSDFINITPFDDMLRGWASIIIFLIGIVSLYLLLENNYRRIKIFIVSYIISGIFVNFIQPSPYFQAEPWKFRFGTPISILLFLLVIILGQGQLSRMSKWAWLLLLLGVVSFYLNSRSLGGMILLCGLILWMRGNPLFKNILINIHPQKALITGILLLVIIYGILIGYVYTVQNGYLGEEAKAKFEIQYNGSLVGLILGGRAEILGAIPAIIDSPIIGHGSWAKDINYRLFLFKLSELGYPISTTYLNNTIYNSDLIPAHSHLTQAWIWAGISGAIFWIWMLIFLIKTFIKTNNYPNQFYPLILFFCIGGIWDILFSPFGAFVRLTWAFHLVVLMTVFDKTENKNYV